ncbi:MAG TPA: tetratricopeptide repeat protein [Pyrinomonadaceae bacterium]|nr:tetratricopeptide repeat protein [Pyrinomonadaceae bacterium]
MFRSLAITVVIVLGVCLDVVPGQTNNYADNPGSARSPEAKAEAKRLYKEGVKYGLAGLYPQAIAILQRSVKLDPQFADAHFALGHAYFDLKQWRNAVESFKAAVELNPKDQEARDRLGLARAMLWEEDSAKLAAQRRQTSPPQSVAEQRRPDPPQDPVAEPVSINVKAPSKAETTAAAAPPAPEVNAAAANEEAILTRIYRIGPSDVLDIRINDNAAPQSTLFSVTPSGFIEHPMLAEPMQASGLTVDELSSKFESELKRRAVVENPKVSVGVRDYASHTILVSGLVKDSGTKILRREAIPLYVVVADAQPLPEAARVTVLRNESNETFEIELGQTKDMSLLVRPGDVITLLPNVTQFVYIGGEVKSPGEKTFRRGLTLTQAIIAAGGVTEKAKEARLGRDNGEGFLVVTRYKLKDIESGKVQDPLVKPGDRITIHD